MKKIENKNIIWLLAILVILLWGSLFPFIKLSYKEFGIDTSKVPNLMVFAGIRFVICGFIIFVFQLIKGKSIPKFDTKKEWIGVVLVGLIAVATHYACTYIGLSSTDSSKTSLLKQSGILVFLCFTFIFSKEEQFSWNKLISAILGVASIIVLSADSLFGRVDLGEVLIIVASLCTVFSNLIFKKNLKTSNAISVTGYSEFIGGLVLLIIGLAFGGKISSVNTKGLLVFTYIIVATVISYSLWYSLVKESELSYLFIVKLSEPLFTAAISVLIINENIWKWEYLVSFLCVVVAMTVVNLKFNKKKDPSNENIVEAKI